jgi:hypothetical protein
MPISLTRFAILATGVAAVLAGITVASGALADQTSELTACRFETYEPDLTPRCGHDTAQFNLPFPPPPPPPVTTPPVIYSTHLDEEKPDRDRGGGDKGAFGGRGDRDATGRPN